MSALTVDRGMMEGFVGALFRYVDEGTYFQLRAFFDRTGKGSDETGAWGAWPVIQLNGSGLRALVEAAVKFAQECADAPKPVVFAPPCVGLNNATEAAEKNIANGIVLSIECDEHPAATRTLLERLLGRPTVVVESGGEWICPLTGAVEPKLHLHWRLTEPTRSFCDHQRLKEARRLAQKLSGSDGSAVPLVHPMRWPGSWHRKGTPRLARIAELNEDAEIDLDEALERLREAVAARGEDPASADYSTHKPNDHLEATSIFDVYAALEVTPNPDLPWDEWGKRVGMATWGATGGSEAGFHAFDAWSKKSKKYDPARTRKRWDGITGSPPDRIGFGTLDHLAKEARPGWRRPSVDFVAPFRRDPPQGDLGADEVSGAPEPRLVTATPFVWTDPASLPRRQFVYGRHLIRGYGSCTVAPSGSGKSSSIVVEALAIVTGRALLDEQPKGQLRCWHINLEDPEDELRRRFAAAAIHYDIVASDIGDRLFLNSGRTTNVVIATETRNGIAIAVPIIEAIKSEIIDKKIDVLQIDPFVACHSVSENDNTKIAAIAREWAMIAEATNCAIELVHHARKSNGQTFTVEDARGASALIAAVRSARVINGMTKAEAEKASVKNHTSYFNITNGKSNLSPRSDKAIWRHIVGVPLGNGERFDPAGDVVGVVEPWQWPDPFTDIGVEDAKDVQRRIAAGEWRESPQSKTWAGIVVAEILGLDVTQKAVKEQVSAALAGWIASGALSVATKRDKGRKPRKFYEVGQWIT